MKITILSLYNFGGYLITIKANVTGIIMIKYAPIKFGLYPSAAKRTSITFNNDAIFGFCKNSTTAIALIMIKGIAIDITI